MRTRGRGAGGGEDADGGGDGATASAGAALRTIEKFASFMHKEGEREPTSHSRER